MTVSSTISRKEYVGNDATVAFDTSPMEFFDESTLEVYVVTDATGASVLQTITTNYTVSGGAGNTGIVTMVVAPATGETLVVVRVEPIVQQTDLVQNDPSDAEVFETALDKGVLIMQQLDESIRGSVRLGEQEAPTDDLTILPFDRASLYLSFDANKKLTATTGTGASNPATDFHLTMHDDADADTTRGTLELSSTDDVEFTGLHASGELRFSGVISPAQLTASQNNWAPTGFAAASQIRFDTDAAGYSITGLAVGQVDGSEMLLANDGAFPVTIPHEDVLSTAANRFDMSNDSDVLLAAGATLLVTYDATASRWRVKGGAGSGGGATGGSGDEVFFLNDQQADSDFTIPADKNAISAGPITVADGVTITVADGARWVVV